MPSVRTSLVVAEWPRDVRLLWVYLWGYLDDFGRGVDDARLVKADCFPLDDDLSSAVIDDWLDMIASSGPLCRYQVGGRRYIHACSWDEHQRPSHPTRSKLPECPIHDAPESLPKSSGEAHEPFFPEKGVRELGRGSAGAGVRALAREAHPPPQTCPDHPNGTKRRCAACGDARTAHNAWRAETEARQRDAPRCDRHHAHLADNCPACRSEAIGADPPSTVVAMTRPRGRSPTRPNLSPAADG